MGTLSFRQQVVYSVALFLLLLLLVPRAGHVYDMGFWVRWSTHIFENGLGNAYQVQDDTYNPVYQYILWLYAHLMGSVEKIQHYSYWLKGFTLLFDFAGAFWAASLASERARRFGLALALLLNLGYLYNTLVWSQIDSIYTFFAFGAVVLAAQRRSVLSVLCYVLAIATKTQAIIFLPPLLLLWLPQWWRQPRQAGLAGLAGGTLAVLVVAPFVWFSWENYLPRIIANNLEVIGIFPQLSVGAFNSWYLLTSYDSLAAVADTLPFAGLTYHKWGLLLFFAFSAVALLPLFLVAGRALRARPAASPAPDMALVLLSCGSIPLLFAFFNTQMHERYWHSAILFLAAYGFVRRDYLPYILSSAAYFLNLEAVLRYLQLMNYSVLLFKPQFVAGIFGVTIFLILLKIYRLAPWRAPARAETLPSAPVTVA